MTDSTVFVYTMNRAGQVGAWSRYMFPFSVDCFAQLGNDLYIRHGDVVSIVRESAVTDEVDGNGVPFAGIVQWNWLDFGRPGAIKMLEGVDYVGTGQGPTIAIGYDQRNLAQFTTPYQLDPDTLPGGILPLPVAAPTMSVKLEYLGGSAWAMQAVNVYLHDMDNGPG